MRTIRQFLAILLIPCLALLNLPFSAFAQTSAAVAVTTKIVHNPAKSVDFGKRPQLSVTVKDPQGIDVVRVYFKTVDGESYHFIELDPSPEAIRTGIVTGGEFSGTLPALANDAGWLDYLFLIKNSDLVVVKSQTYTVSVSPGATAAEISAEPIKVYTELDEVPAEIVGFADNILHESVAPPDKFATVAGLYPTTSPGPPGAVAGGTVTASTDGSGMNTVLLGGLAVVAVVGGGIALAGGGGSSSSPSPEPDPSPQPQPTPGPEPPPVLCPYSGNWAGNYNETDCQTGANVPGSWSGTVNNDCYLTSNDTTRGRAYFQGQINKDNGNANLGGIGDACGNSLNVVTTFSGNSMGGTYQGGTVGSLSGSRR